MSIGTQVSELVHNDRLEARGWRQHQSPRERDRAVARGAPPTRRLISDAESHGGDPHLRGIDADHLFGDGARAAAKPAQQSTAHNLGIIGDGCRDLDLTVERGDAATSTNDDAMGSPGVRDQSTDRQSAVRTQRGATRGDVGEGAVDPLEASCDERLNIAPCACLAVALWHHRLKAMLRIDAQREASCAKAANQAIRSGAHAAEFRTGAASLGAWDAVPMRDATSTLTRRSRAAIYAAIFLAFIDNFALLPVIGPRAQELGGTPLLVGIAIAAYSLANLAFNPIGGILADRIGRRRVVVAALVISPLAIGIYALADSLPLFLLARVVHGASGGVLAAALFALLGDAAPVGERGRTLGRAGALIGIAAVFGPAAAALVSNFFGVNAVFVGVAGFIAIGLAAVLPLLPETLVVTPATRPTVGAWRRILSEPRVRVALLAIFGLEAAVGTVTGFIKDGLIQRALQEGRSQEEALRYAAGASGGLFTIFGVIAIALMLSRVSTRVDNRGPFGVSLVGLVALIGALTLLAISPTFTIDLVAMLLYGIGYGLIFPAAAGAIAIASAPEERGRANGAFSFSFDLGISTGPILSGLVATAFIGVTPFAGGLALVVLSLALLPIAARGAARGATRG